MVNMDTLDRILGLIDRDTRLIEESFRDKQLDPNTALSLTRYASALSSIKEGKQKDSDKERKSLERLSTDELIELYKQSSNK